MHEVWSMDDIDIPVFDDLPEYPPDAEYAVIERSITYRGLVPRLR